MKKSARCGKKSALKGGKFVVGLKRVFVTLARDRKVRSHIMKFNSEQNEGARGPDSIVDASKSVKHIGENGQKWRWLGVMNPMIFLNLQAPLES